MQMKGYSSKPFTFGQFTHARKAYDVDHQVTLSGNRDTIYSFGVFDLSKPDLTITMPDSKGKYMTLMPISQDHDVYRGLNAPGTYTFKQSEVGTRYMVFVIRVLMDPNESRFNQSQPYIFLIYHYQWCVHFILSAMYIILVKTDQPIFT